MSSSNKKNLIRTLIYNTNYLELKYIFESLFKTN